MEGKWGSACGDGSRGLGLHPEDWQGEPWKGFQPQSDTVIFGKIPLAA